MKLPSVARPGSIFCLAVLLMISAGAAGQAQPDYQYGSHIEPAFEGWRPNENGSFSFMFGYMNENWAETPDIPVGENNFFEPGDADRGQPTHFLPRRNRWTFEVIVSADWGDRELVWTISHNGATRSAYASLREDYLVDNMVIASETGSLGAGTSSPESRANMPPVVEVSGDEIRQARVGEPIFISTRVTDDGLPVRRRDSTVTSEAAIERMLRRPSRVTVGKVNGLFLSWNKYRGPSGGMVTIDPPLPKPWEDTRASANSPWGPLWLPPPIPEDGIYEVIAAFSMPGTYVLWARADDGGLYHDQYLTVNVTE